MRADLLHPGDTVIVPFPYAESKGHKWRPALVISSASFHEAYGLCWAVMITSADNPSWSGDIVISSLQDAGLRSPSVVRPAKIAALQMDKLEKIGSISLSMQKEVAAFISGYLMK